LPFRLTDEEKFSSSPIGPRLHVSKQTRLLEVADRTAVEAACLGEVLALIDRHDVVAVVVNRVASASTVARQLQEAIGNDTDIALLTGRMRPLDRDDILKTLQPRIATGRDRAKVGRKLVVVGTQCIEAGADFDFDALVTEAASLDALRQRFGRVDRLGTYLKAEGVIVRDKSAKEDPIYGEAIAKTMEWLKGRVTAKSKKIDFGVLALPMPETEDLEEMVAPKAHAPALLPAYLDLWMQTSPPPVTTPDVSLWLHGPRSGPADVQIVWRVDLTDEVLQCNSAKDLANAIVAAVRPSSLEAISLPFHAARRWLQGDEVGNIADVEGVGDSDDQSKKSSMLAFRWDGDDSEVITSDKLRPGDTIVVPSTRGGIERGCFEPRSTAPVNDLAERAALFGRGQPMLRLHPAVLAQLGLPLSTDDAGDARAALAVLAQDAERSDWRRVWFEGLAASRTTLVVDAPEPWEVLQGRRIRPGALRNLGAEDGGELTTDDDDSFYAGQSVSLAEHSADVEQFARQYAAAAGLPGKFVEDLALAGWLHDIGKADRRFQILLRGGSEIDFFKDETPWAKSGMPTGAKGAHRLAERKSGYPRQVSGKSARHEVQSLAMIEKHLDIVKAKANDSDLVLHLVASHHGHCRPFAPVVVDDDPVEVELPGHRSETFGTIDFSKVSSKHDLHRLDSPLAERFWRLVERYGWLELCWLEAILRLADHRASEAEQTSGDAP
jgi:CRISPR-associated endonuclease/helicase Cas3